MPNKFIYNNISINDNETVLKTIRQSKCRLIFGLTPAALVIVACFFFFYLLFSWGNYGIIIFILLLLTGIILLTRGFVVWYYKIFIITNQRVIDIDQQRIFYREVSDIPLIKIQDVFYRIKGIIQTMTRTGNIEIMFNDNKTKIEIKNIPQPQKIQQLIIQLKNDFRGINSNLDNTTLSAEELVNLVKKIKAGLGEEKFKEIIKDITPD